ncbi:alanyl-tRNA synthetase [Entomoplasma freundtii]|uniref:Alanine--tRNA ligase n=1 Tax=Entomoplasma freundtii TaxID=74700 RepID=A0A2K8NRI9_9MOLU|nr:alanine--tRNA ligase [Entomoplasma freundtii]ATZ16146.1 alanyl-tRNA synthetase [Entomoplasma freundtii]TDY56953.1 alanyl-tRNA synthetase [Entomoplasma freundtii]
MRKLSTNEIRQMWLDFFQSKGHHFLAPASLIPVNDPSLLWINSGVATLKPYFEGRKNPPSSRLTNSQKAIRTNDIENVGVTSRHQTMFEMLGNFSIGDYFKAEAITMAWELLTSPEWFDIPKEKLYITVFNEDQDAYDFWKNQIGIPEDHLFSLTRDTNFWDVGQGPCGPNTEIFFDRGQQWDPLNLGTKLLSDDIENDRYIEIWNVVFSQFNNDGTNCYTELPRKNIDTGAGLERLASIFQETPTNFETDIFFPTIKKIETFTKDNVKYSLDDYQNPNPAQTKVNVAFKVIADHVRAVSFAIADGVFPGNKDRNYVIRRLIRRASTYGFELGINGAFLYKLVPEVIKSMGQFYPYLQEKAKVITETIKDEEEKFLKTLSKGYTLLNKIIAEEKTVSGKNAWLLFESFGFPIELTLEIAQKNQIPVAIDDFKKLANEAREQARQARQDQKAWDKQSEFYTKLKVPSEFTGWNEIVHEGSKVVYLFVNEKEVTSLENTTGFLILDKTPFYAEKGGQAGDAGIIRGPHGTAYVFDTQQGPNHQHIHQVNVQGKISLNDLVDALVDEEKRLLTMKNHSGTHMIHWALREVLGTTVMQAGSYNDEKGLRMDFTFNRPIKPEELAKAQALVLEKIQKEVPRKVYFCSMEEAVNKHQALAFFTEKYDEIVRVIKFGDFSCELCGGTHVRNTKEIEDFLITNLESKGNGLFRIKALTSFQTIENYLQHQFGTLLEEIDQLQDRYQETKALLVDKQWEIQVQNLKALPITKDNLTKLKKGVANLYEMAKDYRKKVQAKQTQLRIKPYLNLEPVSATQDAPARLQFMDTNLNLNELKELADSLKQKHPQTIIILGGHKEDNHFLVVTVAPELQTKYSAIEIFKNLPGFNTQGGGNVSFAQGRYKPINEN